MTGGGSSGGRLAVKVDGVVVPEGEARGLWQRFSAYMEEHRGDLAGFAAQEGFKSAHPRSEGGKAVLVLSRTEPQEAYGKAPPSPPPPRPTQGKTRRSRR